MGKGFWLWAGALVLATMAVGLWLFWEKDPSPEYPKIGDESVGARELEPTEPLDRSVGRAGLETGDTIEDLKNPRLLRHYGEANRTAKDDLDLVNGVLQRFWMLFKDPDLLMVGSNEDIVRSLSGGNPEGIAFVSPENRYIDSEGRLLDRWGMPLFFHAESMTRIEVRSSGPDRKRFTNDDVVVMARSSARLRN
ncbi:hypothetical protein VDG1235_2406 [Verrucomicrobiia bacterium DG1235]|nr:hypothetical protein VDG1235_2406 [Verrucomicrobiae bacterium DG1235]